MKIAVITGASSGIGKEICFALQDRIPAIQEFWLFSRRKESLQEVEEQLFRPVRLFSWDLTKEECFQKYEDLLIKENPEILFLVNVAGFGKLGRVTEISVEEQLKMLDLNVKALTAFTLKSLEYMGSSSRIIQMASAAAFLPQAEFSVYAATKSYVYSFSLSLREELRNTGVGLTVVCPGPVDTPFFAVAGGGGRMQKIKQLFMAKPKKVAKLAVMDAVLNRPISIYGLPMKGFYLLCQMCPDMLLIPVVRKFYR